MGTHKVYTGVAILGFCTISLIPLRNAYSADTRKSHAPDLVEASYTIKKPTENLNDPLKLNPNLDLKGWDHLYSLLLSEGVDAQTLAQIFTDKRMPEAETLYFSIKPKESKHLYRKVNTPKARKQALSFYREHKEAFRKAELQYGVPKSIILALLQVETRCGQNTGDERVFYRLARLANASAPENITENYKDKYPQDRTATLEKIKARALTLQNLFLPHLSATIKLAKTLSTHPLEIRGSYGGAIGLPQFLPGNILTHGADGNKDGHIDLYQPVDAIPSVAKFLHNHGWNKKRPLKLKEKREVIWNYNRSEPYISAVLEMARSLEVVMGIGSKKSL